MRPENICGSVHLPVVPQSGQVISSIDAASRPFFASYASSRWSWRCRLWHCRHSTSGSVKVATWPDACQTAEGRMIEESRPTMSSRPCTNVFHHWRLMFSLSATPRGP